MGRVLSRLEHLEREVLPLRMHPLLGRPSLHASLIQGGEGLSTYPPSCELRLERRTLPNEDEPAVRAELDDVLATLRRDDPTFEASVEVTGARPGLEVDRNAVVVRALDGAYAEALGTAPAYVGAAYWTDASLLAHAGIPAVLFGPGGEGAHAEVEYVDLASAVMCARVLAGTIESFCGASAASASSG